MNEFRLEATERFSCRSADYSAGRPSYPAAAVEAIVEKVPADLPQRAIDIGAGTGSLTRLLLEHDFQVVAVEPSPEMRHECDALSSSFENYSSACGTAESIPVDAGYASLITAAQAFHWFDPVLARKECLRVLRPRGIAAILWNNREASDELQRELSSLFANYGGERYSAQQGGLERQADLETFFGKAVLPKTYENVQSLNEDSFIALGRSRSYMPAPGCEEFDSATAELSKLHQRYAKGGVAAVRYQTQLYLDVLE